MQRTDKPFTMGYGITNTTWDDDKKWAYLDLTDPNNNPAKASEILPQGRFWNFKPTKGMTYTQSILIDTDATFNPNGQAQNSWFTTQGHNSQKGYFEKLSETTYRFWSTCTWQLEDIALRAFDWFGLHGILDFRNSGTYLAFYKPKLEISDKPSEWVLAPEDLGWSTVTLVPTQQQRYLWKFEYIYYSDGSVEVTQPVNISIAGADADTTGVTDAINQTNQTVANLQNSVSQAQSDLATVSSNLTQARQNLESSIASVNTKAQAVETTLAQVQSTANANSQKTATLENDLDGLSAKFDNLKIGGHNYLRGTSDEYQTLTSDNYILGYTGNKGIYWPDLLEPLKGKIVTIRSYIKNDTDFPVRIQIWFTGGGINGNPVPAHEEGYSVATGKIAEEFANCNVAFVQVGDGTKNGGTIQHKEDKLEVGNIATDYSPNESDVEQKVAEYKQTADQNYASLQSTVQALDGTVTANKTTADQTAAGFKTRIESLETYQSGETARANQYFESAKTETARQLTAERTAIANDYVAKSTYTEDVTGLRNDLTATTTTANTTKTSLASYQASNDQAVASLQSSLQTTDGNVSSLQTQINAVPGQITSAVSAVEGKIPTEIGSSNLLRNTSVNADNLSLLRPSSSTVSIVTKDGHQTYKVVVSGNTNSGAWFKGNNQYYNLIKDRYYTFSFWVLTNKDKKYNFNSLGHIQACNYHDDKVGSDSVHQHTSPVYSTNVIKANTWTKVWCTFKATSNSYFLPYFWYLAAGDEIYIYDMMLNEGKIPLSYTLAIEDTQSDITKLSSELTQTKAGMTLLATKTELNTAKSELQSGITTATSKADSAQATANNNAQTISTHTTQISALNTGLQAKVSQSDFDSLSGRVSSAESNLTATASQLSSQISSVENKIPTSLGGRNYIKNSEYRKATIYVNDSQVQDEAFDISSAFWQNSNVYAKKIKLSFCYQPSVAYETERKFPVYFRTSPWPLIGEVTYPANTTRLIKYTLAMTSALPANFTADQIFIRFSGNFDKGRYHNIGKVMLEASDVFSDWSPAPEDYDSALATAKSEIKQTTDSISAAVSSVETKANAAQSAANTAVSKANAAQTAVNTLDSEVVKSASLNLDNNGFVTKVGKTIDGNKFATMIAQDANNVKIIADEMQVTANMIVDGAVTAEKLNVSNLSAVNSNLGKIEGGSLLLQENKTASSSVDSWGTFDRPAHKQGLYMDNHGLASSGAIQRKNGGETTPTDMPLAVLQSGELRFLVVDYNDNLENVLHYGLSDPDYGVIKFEIDSELKRRLTMTSSGYLNFQATNYTNWQSTGVSGCEYMIQGRLVLVNYDVTFSSAGTQTIGSVPQEFVKKSLMLTAKGWSVTPRDKNIQLNPDGGLHILDAEANVNYRGTLVFSY